MKQTMSLISGADVSMPSFEPQEDILSINDLDGPLTRNETLLKIPLHLKRIATLPCER